MASLSAATSTQKHEFPLKKLKETKGEDIISNLPEDVISLILSFLPTKDAIQTSELSKSWIHRLTSLTTLNLDDSEFYGKRKTGSKAHFVNFVNRALVLTKGSSMQSVSLVIANKYDHYLLNTWISEISLRRVKNLRICTTDSELTFCPLTSYSLFNYQYNMEELMLEMCCSTIKLIACLCVSFERLKFLKLCGIICTFDYTQLVLDLPNLTKFETKNCSWVRAGGRGRVTVKVPLLQSIFIEHDFASVSRDPRSCTIIFSATQLKKFTYNGYGISQRIILSAPSSASNASVNIILKQHQNITVPETGSCAFLLLEQFSQAKCIKFDGSKVLLLAQQNVAVLPVFAMLCRLELNLVTCEILLGLLNKSPILKTLVLKGISKFEQELLNSSVVPKCLTSTLQIVKFENVNGCEHELYLAKFFLGNGTVLERMSFSHTYWLDEPKVMEEFKEKLFSYKKCFSSFAIVEFS